MQSFKSALSATLAVSAFALTLGSAALPAAAQVTTPGTPITAGLRGERGSAANLLRVRRRLEAMIDQLQRDQRDYGGNRVKAIADLQAARNDIQTAINYDATHGH